MAIGKTMLIGWNPAAFRKEVEDNSIELQTQRLIEYAEKEIKVLGDIIQTYNSRNHMDRTGNLLNSLCWGVFYNGKRKAYGYYREPVYHDKGMGGSSQSWLHEFFSNDMENVDGHEMASKFLASYKTEYHGWVVFFAILAPYWGYWESGFTMKGGGGKYTMGARGNKAGNIVTPSFNAGFRQFQVMSHIYDDVRVALKPKESRLTVYVPKYIYTSNKWKRKFKNRKGIPVIGRER